MGRIDPDALAVFNVYSYEVFRARFALSHFNASKRDEVFAHLFA